MQTRTLGPVALLALPLLLAAAAPATAQNLPGYQGDYDAAAAQFRAYALGHFQSVLAEWVEAVNEGDIDRAMGLYADDAWVDFGGPTTGRDAAREALGRWVEGVDGIQVGLGDFDASGTMSYGSVRIVINAAPPREDTDGSLVLILKKQGRDWRIRSQALVLD